MKLHKIIISLPTFILSFYTLTTTAMQQAVTPKVLQGSYSAGIGAKDAAILYFKLSVSKRNSTTPILESITMDLSGTTNLHDIRRLKVYHTKHNFGLHADNADAQRLGSYRLKSSQQACDKFTFKLKHPIQLKNELNHFWIVADVSPKAKEGDALDARISSFSLKLDRNNRITFPLTDAEGNPPYTTTVLPVASTVVADGDDNSRFWRIPAITTMPDGKLIAVMDKRFNDNGDLPNKIDICVSESTDGGHTWSKPRTIAGTAELGGEYGHGDPSIVYNKNNGDLFILLISREGFFYSTPEKNGRIKTIVSHDGGKTWSVPCDITDQIYGAGCTDTIRRKWYGAFPASGTIAQTSKGRLLSVLCVREEKRSHVNVYLMYSDDNGVTWTVCPDKVTDGGDESKAVELADGNILISVRHKGFRYMNVGYVDDNGTIHFKKEGQEKVLDLVEPSCNGDMIRYSLQNKGATKNRLLHSIPNDSSYRRNVSVTVSYDEGKTWGYNTSEGYVAKKTICPGGSGYSALTIMPDGTIGCFYEEDVVSDTGYQGYNLKFIRFTLDWLTCGKDK